MNTLQSEMGLTNVTQDNVQQVIGEAASMSCTSVRFHRSYQSIINFIAKFKDNKATATVVISRLRISNNGELKEI